MGFLKNNKWLISAPAFYKASMGLVYLLDKIKSWIVPPSALLVSSIAEGFMLQQCIFVAVNLQLADKIKGGAQQVTVLAQQTGTNPDALYRLLRALAANGIFRQTGETTFVSTPLAKALEIGSDDSVAAWVQYFGSNWHMQQWMGLQQSITTGNDSSKNVHGISAFDWFNKNPEFLSLFNGAMDNISALTNNSLCTAYNFSKHRHVLDIGGGKGGLLNEILKRNLNLTGVLFDNNQVKEQTVVSLNHPRATFIQGNFFNDIPAGSDIYILKSVLHDWNNEQAIKILTNCCKAMAPGAKLLIIEIIINETRNQRQFGKLLDVGMLVLSGGRERSLSEYELLLKAASLKLSQVISTASPFSILEVVQA